MCPERRRCFLRLQAHVLPCTIVCCVTLAPCVIQMLRYTRIQVGFAFAGAWLLSYAAAAVLFLFVEKPFMQMEVLLFKRLGLASGSD